MSKSVREQVECWSQMRPNGIGSATIACGLLVQHRELFAAAEETAAEVARLREALANCEAWSRRAVTTQECVVACQQIMNEAAAALQQGDSA